jgi:hypothetical protein
MEKLPVECCKNIRYKNLADFIIVIYVIRPKGASLSSESVFSGRGAAEACKQARTKGTFFN